MSVEEIQAAVAEARAELEAAEAAKEALVEERRENRESMLRADFRAYNEATRQKQIDIQRAVDEAQRKFSAALDRQRYEIAVGTLSEAEGLG